VDSGVPRWHFAHIGLIVMSVAVWRSNAMPRWVAALLAAAGVIGLPAILEVPLFQRVAPIFSAAAFLALAAGIWRRAAHSRRTANST
jgi:hypothetical protein